MITLPFALVSTLALVVSLALTEEDVKLHLEEGIKLHQQADLRGAIRSWESGLQIATKYRQLPLVATLLESIAETWKELGEHEKALSCYEEALKAKRELADPEKGKNLLERIVSLCRQMGDHVRALDYLGQLLVVAKESEDRKTEGNCLNDICAAHLRAGNSEKALSFCEAALAVSKQLADKTLEDTALNNLGAAHISLGEYERARRCLHAALEIKASRSDLKGVADLIGNLGAVDLSLGNYSAALNHLNNDLVMRRQLGDLEGEAIASSNLGVLYGDLGDYGRAFDYLQKSLQIGRRLRDRSFVAGTQREIGDLYAQLGNYDQALAHYLRAGEFNDPGGARPGSEEFSLGQLYLDMGHLTRAFTILNRHNASIPLGRYYLLTRDYEMAKWEFFRNLQVDERQRNARVLQADWIGLGLAFEGSNEPSRSKTFHESAVDLMEREREGIAPHLRHGFLNTKVFGFRRLEAYEGLVRAQLRLNQPEQAFYWSEHTKARSLMEALSQASYDSNLGLPSALRQREQDLINRIAATRKQSDQAREKQNTELQTRLAQDLKTLKQQQQELVAQLRQQHPEYAAMQYPTPMQASELALKNNEVLVAYEVTDPVTLAFVLRQGRVVKVVEIKISRKELRQQVEDYRRVFVEIGQTGSLTAFSKLDVKLGYRLYELLLKEALAEVKDGEKVLVAPDEILNLLPMEALVEELPLGELEWEEKGHGLYPKGVKYVGDRRVLSYWQSGSSLTVARRLGKPVEGHQLLAIADPVFDRGDERLKKTQTKTAAGDQLRLMREMTDATSKYLGWARFPRLVNTEKLVERLQGVYGNQMKSLTGLQATESAVKSQSLEQYGAGVVFATHGIVDEQVPYLQQAALVMTNPELTGEGEVSDGFLTMTEVMNLKMPTELVGAMACVTGVGGEVAGEGVMNLGRAFQYAGARSVLVSLWSVEAESTSLLGQHVLEAVKDGKPKDQALLEARQLLRKQGYEHPLFWAGFILVGERDAAQLVAAKGLPRVAWLVGVGSVALVIG